MEHREHFHHAGTIMNRAFQDSFSARVQLSATTQIYTNFVFLELGHDGHWTDHKTQRQKRPQSQAMQWSRHVWAPLTTARWLTISPLACCQDNTVTSLRCRCGSLALVCVSTQNHQHRVQSGIDTKLGSSQFPPASICSQAKINW